MRRAWAITRERDDGQPLVAALVVRGVDARALPCIQRRALPWPTNLTPSTSGRTIVMCTSAFAAQIVAAQPWLQSVDVAAVAPATAAVLERAAVRVAVRAEGGTVALAEAIVDDAKRRPVARVLYPTSNAGLDAQEQARALELLAGITTVERAVVYTTDAAPTLAGDVRELPHRVGFVLFSPSAVDALLDARPDLEEARAVCVGASTARAWRARTTCDAIEVSKGASVVDTLISLDESERQEKP